MNRRPFSYSLPISLLLIASFIYQLPVVGAARFRPANATTTSDTNSRGSAEYAPSLPAAVPNSISRSRVTNPAYAPFFAPSLTATLADDIGLGAKKNPGDTITYTAVITNGGASPADDATGMIFSAVLDNATTLVGGSINAQPIAKPDSYTGSGNIPIAIAAPGVLTNDVDPMTGTNTGLTVTEVNGSGANVGVATNTTAIGAGGVTGSVNLATNGSFTYEPPPGYVGNDTFTYKTSEGTLTDTNTVTITITNMVWFIKNTGGGLNRGTFSNPFTSIASFNTANALADAAPNPKSGDIIALRTGTYAEADGVNLRNNQKLIGEAVQFNTAFSADGNSSSAYTTFAGATNTAPTIATSAGNGIDLASGNTVRGLSVGNTPGFFGFNGGVVGSPIINTVAKTGTGGAINVSTSAAFGANVTFTTLASSSSPGANINLVGVTGTLGITSGGSGLSGSNASSNAITLSGGSASFTYPGNVTKTNGGSLLNVSGGHTGTLIFNTGTLDATAGDGLQFNNADGSYTFSGTTTLHGGDAGVDIIGGSDGTFSFASTTSISDPSGTSFNINGGTGNVTYNGTITDDVGLMVAVANTTAGTKSFTGAITDNNDGDGTEQGVTLTTNPGATISFSGGLRIRTTTNTAFNATGGGSVNVCDENPCNPAATGALVNTLTTSTGTALNLNGTTTAGNKLEFQSISATGGSIPIVLNSSAGNLTVNGDGTGQANGSGGALSSATTRAIHMLNASGTATLKSMNIGINSAAEGAVLVDNNTSGNLTVNLTGCAFTGANSVSQNKALVQFESGTAASLTSNVQNCYFNGSSNYGLFYAGVGTSTLNITVNQNGFGTNVNSGAAVNQPGTTLTNPNKIGMAATIGSSAQVSFNITNNTFWGASTGANYAVVFSGGGTTSSSLISGTFSGNEIGKSGTPLSGCSAACGGVGILPGTNGTVNVTVSNNEIRQVNRTAIDVFNSAGGATHDTNVIAKITNNIIEDPDLTGAPSAALLRAVAHSLGNSGGSAMHGCLTISGNTITGAWPLPIRITTLNTTGVLLIPGLSPSSGATAAQVETYIEGLNGAANATVSIGGAINNTAGSAPCPLLFARGGVREVWHSPSPILSLLFPMLSTSSGATGEGRSIINASHAVSPSLSQRQLDSMVTAALQRWSATGLSSRQMALLRELKFEIADLQGAYLGEANGNRIQIDNNAEGNGWFLDPTPLSDASFPHPASATRRYTDPMNAPAGQIDLLTVIEHELGHRLGLLDTYAAKDRDNLMYGHLTVGERRLPARGQAKVAMRGALKGSHFLSLSPSKESSKTNHAAKRSSGKHASADDQLLSPLSGETVTVNGAGTGFLLPGGDSITITFQATVNTPPTARAVSVQGKVSGTNFTLVNGITTASPNTNDPETAAVNDATVTNINTTSTWTGALSTNWNDASNWSPTTYAPGVGNSGVNDVVIPNVGQQPNLGAAMLDVNIYSLNISNGRTLTIDPARTLTLSGTAGSDLTLDGIISGGALQFAGAGPHLINNAGGTGNLSPTNVLTVLSPAVVTLNHNLQAGALAVSAGGSLNITGKTLSLNGSGAALGVAGTFTTTGSTIILNGTAAQTIAGTTYNNLTINNTLGAHVTGVTLTGNATVNGILTLTSSDLATGANTLTMPAGATSAPATGATDVLGNVKRTGLVSGGSALSFGNPLNTIRINSGTAPTDINVLLAKNVPATYALAVQRSYTITPNGGSGINATVRLHYRQAELNGNDDTSVPNFNFRRFTAGAWKAVVPTSRNTGVVEDNWLENNSVTTFSEWTFANLSPSAAAGTVSGIITTSNGTPVEGTVVRLSGDQNRKTITDAKGRYSFDNVDINGFYTVTPSRANYHFNPFNRAFSQLTNQTDAAFGASFTGDNANPLDTAEYFVRQQYVDLLGREPDEGGFNYWSDELLKCGADVTCVNTRRSDIAAAFFIEQEFQQTGAFIYNVYKSSLGRKPGYPEYTGDRKLVIGGPELETEKAAFAASFVKRAEFVEKYQSHTTGESFVDALLQQVWQTSNVDLGAQRGVLLGLYQTGTDLNQSRALVIRQLVSDPWFKHAEYNPAFVLTEYFSYLRRNPEPDGYDFWLNVLNNREPGNFRGMVCSFITSAEYQNRFSSVVSHNNGECGK